MLRDDTQKNPNNILQMITSFGFFITYRLLEKRRKSGGLKK